MVPSGQFRMSLQPKNNKKTYSKNTNAWIQAKRQFSLTEITLDKTKDYRI